MTLLPNIRALIAGSIHSVAALELLLLLHRSPDTYWTRSAAAARLGVPEERIAAAFAALRGHGLVVEARETMAFRYAPHTDFARDTVDALAAAYEQQRLQVLDAVNASDRASIDAFAEAFRIRRS